MATTSYGTPYVQSSDLVSGWPTASLNVADRIDAVSYAGNGLNAQTGTSYTLVVGDAGKTITLNNAAAVAVSLPQDSTANLPAGAIVNFYNLGAGAVTISAGAGATFQGGPVTIAQYGYAAVIKLSANTYGVYMSQSAARQIKSTFKADTFTTTSTSLVDVTGLSVSITPSSASNLVLVMVSLALVNNTAGGTSRGAIIRGSTQIAGGTAAGSRGSATFRSRGTNTADTFLPQHFTYLDSPATTSATTYKVQIVAESGTTAMVGYSAGADSDSTNYPRLASSITVMEVTP